MNVRFWSEDGSQYITIRPEEFKECVKKRRKKGKTMPIPKQGKQSVSTSHAAVSALGEAEAKALLEAFIDDIEETLQSSGKDSMFSIKLGYKSGYQVSLKPSRTGMWYNVTRDTLLDCIIQYLEGEFDNV